MPSLDCPHGVWHVQCKECNGGGICVHGNLRDLCETCENFEICVHDKRKVRCSLCRKSGLKHSTLYYKVCSALGKSLPPQLSRLLPRNERWNTIQERIHNLYKDWRIKSFQLLSFAQTRISQRFKKRMATTEMLRLRSMRCCGKL